MHMKVYVEVRICTLYTTAKFEVLHYNIVVLFVYCFTCKSVVMQCGNTHLAIFFLQVVFVVCPVRMQLDPPTFWLSVS
jgi:hypothetical protein